MQMTYFLFVAALVLLHFITTSSASSSVANNHHNSASDLNGLLAFKANIFDPQNMLPLDWSTSASICNWTGITCNTRRQRVTGIDLSNMGLIGTIPPQLGNLSFLDHFNVTNNSFHGELPTELSRLHRLRYINVSHNRFSGSLLGKLSNFTKLETIDLAYNFLTGNLSGEFSALPNLKVLNMGSNQLVGPLPEALFNLSSLQILSLTNNSLSGDLPAHICNHLPQLEMVLLAFNQFEGEIPSVIGECSRLQVLSMSHNKFVGEIPTEVWNLTTLREIYFSRTNITGEIPKGIGNLYNLKVLSLKYTNVTGTIPQEVGHLSKLEIISLDSNSMSGFIPLKLFNMSTLRIISLTHNNFSGELPSTLGVFLPNLEELYLGSNKFTGSVLTSISNASRLIILDFGINHFTGAIPHSLGNLRLLEHLCITQNDFSVDSQSKELSFLVSLANCRHLRKLSIAVNPLNGFLPIYIGNLSSSLALIDASYCGIRDGIPSSIGNLSNLVELAFEGNSLTGPIPTTIKWLLNLQRIDLRQNQLQGAIPSEFCQLLNLGELDLGVNKLSSTVPSCIGNNTSLRYIYLDSNNLSSRIPASFWSLRNLLVLDMSVNCLTGALPSEIENLNALFILNLSSNQYYGNIPSTIGALQNLQVLSLERNKLQGLIPESMKSMLQLWHLDLSFNNLEGGIPNSLEVLSSLQYFNVSYNRLTGPVPQGGPFVNFTNLSFLSNEALCGAPWLQPCRSTFGHKSRTRKLILIVLLAARSLILVIVISFLLMRLKLRRKVLTPTEDLFPMATIERTSFNELQHITNGFGDSNFIGSGTFGSVYKGIRENGMIWAIKVFDMYLEGEFKSFDRECAVLSCLRHRNLTKVISACSSPDFKALVLEYMTNGSLEKWLYSKHHFLNIRERLNIMIDVACGLEYLHHGYSTPVVHCDLKPSNILLDQDMVGHVSDFGIAKSLGDGETVVQTKTLATFGYIAPEYGLEGLVSTSCDVYSFGITLMETFTKRKPKDQMFTEELSLRRWIQESLPDSVVQLIDVDLLHLADLQAERKIECISSILQLALACTAHAPRERINIKDAVSVLEKIKIQFFDRSDLETES